MPEREKRCETCRFWGEEDREIEVTFLGRYGRLPCHGTPPNRFPRSEPERYTDPAEPDWPWTHPDDWCGPWQPKDPITMLGDLVRQTRLTRLVA